MARDFGSHNYTDDELAVKLEPYLKMGLSLRKACYQAGIARDNLRRRCKNSKSLSATIEAFRGYKSALFGNIILAKLTELGSEVATAQKTGTSIRNLLTRNDYGFLRFLARDDKSLQEEWGGDIIADDEEDDVPYSFHPPKNNDEAELQQKVLNKHHDYVEQKRAKRAALRDRED